MDSFKITVEKASHTYDVDFGSFPEPAQRRVIAYGLTQLLSDAAASVATTANIDGRRIPLAGNALASATMAAKALSDARLDDLSKGILRRMREGDPVTARAKQIAIRFVNKSDDFRQWLATNAHKATDKPAIEELAKRAEVIAASAKTIALAERQLADEADLDEAPVVASKPAKAA